MSYPNRSVKTEHGLSRKSKLSMADEAMRSTAAENKKLLPSVRGKRPPGSAYGSQATIIIGTDDDKRIFHVDHSLLTFYSGYFQAALSGRWTAAEGDAIRLDTETSRTFEHFVSWLYTRSITDDDDEKANCQLIIDLWLFADRREIPLLMNEMLDALKDRIVTEKTIPTTLLGTSYERTTPGSALRRMIVRAITNTASERLMVDNSKKALWPHDALWDTAKELLRFPRQQPVGIASHNAMDICPLFHTHEEGVRCVSKGTSARVRRWRSEVMAERGDGGVR